MGRIEEVFLGGFYARFMVLTKYLGRPCMMGKSLLFRRAAMVAIGGLEALAPYLAEDLVAGEKFTQAGFQIGLSRYPVFQVIGRPSFATFWNRHLRWGQIRKTHASLLFLIELPFTNAFIAASFASISAASLGFSGPLAFAGFLATWVSFDLWAIRAGSGSLKWHQPFSCLMREALRIPLWVHIALSSRVTWKGRSFQMGKDGRLMSLRRAETDEQSEDAALPIRSWRQGASSSESDTRR
jgi:ceramide glucosyltransferase